MKSSVTKKIVGTIILIILLICIAVGVIDSRNIKQNKNI